MPAQRTVRMMAIGSFLLFSTCSVFYFYSSIIRVSVRDQLVEEWLDIVFERRHHAGLDSTGVLTTEEDYREVLWNLSLREQRIVFHTEFPSSKNGLRDFLTARATRNYHSTGFWGLLFGSILVFAASVSWLSGVTAGLDSTKESSPAAAIEA